MKRAREVKELILTLVGILGKRETKVVILLVIGGLLIDLSKIGILAEKPAQAEQNTTKCLP